MKYANFPRPINVTHNALYKRNNLSFKHYKLRGTQLQTCKSDATQILPSSVFFVATGSVLSFINLIEANLG